MERLLGSQVGRQAAGLRATAEQHSTVASKKLPSFLFVFLQSFTGQCMQLCIKTKEKQKQTKGISKTFQVPRGRKNESYCETKIVLYHYYSLTLTLCTSIPETLEFGGCQKVLVHSFPHQIDLCNPQLWIPPSFHLHFPSSHVTARRNTSSPEGR